MAQLAGTGYDIQGGKRLLKTLRAAGVDLEDLKPVNGEAAKIVEQAARSAVPTRTGRLRMTLRSAATKRSGVIRAGNNRKNGGVPYANPIHWGWLARGIKPNPWLSRTAQKTEPQWYAKYKTFTERVLGKVKGK